MEAIYQGFGEGEGRGMVGCAGRPVRGVGDSEHTNQLTGGTYVGVEFIANFGF